MFSYFVLMWLCSTMSDVKGYVAGGFAILATLFALNSATDIPHGNLESGLTPGGVDFAIAHPTYSR